MSQPAAPPSSDSGSGAYSHEAHDLLVLRRDDTGGWRLRDDVRRAIIYRLDEDTGHATQIGLIHPSEAIIISMFDGRRTKSAVERDVGFVFDVDASAASHAVARVLEKWPQAISRYQPGDPAPETYDPSRFVVPAGLVDLSRRRLYKPLTLLCRVSDDCMRDCIYCNVQRRRTRDLVLLSVERWRELAVEAANLGVVSVTFGGGDPFMHPRVLQIIGAFREAGHRLMISTKSHVSSRRAGQLAALGVDRIQVSVDALGELADFMTGSPGYGEQSLDSIANLRGHGIAVRCNCIITSHNVESAPALITKLVELGVDTIRITPYALSSYVQHGDGLFASLEQLKWLKGEVEAATRRHAGTDLALSNVPTRAVTAADRAATFNKRAACGAGVHGLIILSDGKVITCDEMPVRDPFVMGDVTTSSIMDVWASPRIEELLFPPRLLFRGTACWDCDEFDACHRGKGRCFRDAFKAFGTVYAPPPNCPRAPDGRRLF